jgi:hypothetical protein
LHEPLAFNLDVPITISLAPCSWLLLDVADGVTVYGDTADMYESLESGVGCGSD